MVVAPLFIMAKSRNKSRDHQQMNVQTKGHISMLWNIIVIKRN